MMFNIDKRKIQSLAVLTLLLGIMFLISPVSADTKYYDVDLDLICAGQDDHEPTGNNRGEYFVRVEFEGEPYEDGEEHPLGVNSCWGIDEDEDLAFTSSGSYIDIKLVLFEGDALIHDRLAETTINNVNEDYNDFKLSDDDGCYAEIDIHFTSGNFN